MDSRHPTRGRLAVAWQLDDEGARQPAPLSVRQSEVNLARQPALVHLAVAGGTPTVAIFGLTNAKAWGPFTPDPSRQQAAVVRLNLPCMPCFYRGHDLGTPEGCATRDCLALLGVDPVATAARRLLRQTKNQHAPYPWSQEKV